MTGVAVVGIGSWGRNLVRTFDELAEVVMCCHTGNPESAAWLTETYPAIERTTDYEAVLEAEEIDAIVIATPIPTLADLAERAIRAGKDVFVEKPMAQSADRADRLTTLAIEEDALLFVGYIFAHHPFYERTRSTTGSGAVDHLRLEWTTLGTFGPALVDNLVCHPVSVAVRWLGIPRSVEVTERHHVTGDLDVLGLDLGYEDATCSIRVDRAAPDKGYVARVYTNDGQCHVATDDTYHEFVADEGAFAAETQMATDPLTTECARFLEARAGTTSPVTDGQFGARVATVLDRIKSALDGRG